MDDGGEDVRMSGHVMRLSKRIKLVSKSTKTSRATLKSITPSFLQPKTIAREVRWRFLPPPPQPETYSSEFVVIYLPSPGP